MKVCFAVSDLSSLRYYGPIIEFLKNENNVEIILSVRRDANKYNTLLSEKNYIILKNIVSTSFNPAKIIPMSNSKIKCNIAFTVENIDAYRFDCERHYAIQHAFDYTIPQNIPTSNTIYLCNSEKFGKDIKSRLNIEYIVPPLPVAFSNINRQIEFAKRKINTDKDIAFIFYSQLGLKRAARSVIKYLKKKGYFIIIKQRAKWQAVPSNTGADLILYDEIWYPSESIFCPLISKIVIGFGTTAYTDLCEVGINFIDNAIPKYAKNYIKPDLNNFWYIENKFIKKTKEIIEEISPITNNIKIISEDIVKRFYFNLLKIN